MLQDPIGLLGRMNAASLMMITPEFYKVRRLRRKHAAKINSQPAAFAINPQHMQLADVTIRFARGGRPDGPTILFLSPLPQSILCYDQVWAALAPDANLIALDMPGFGGSEGDMHYMRFEAQSAFLALFVAEMGIVDFHIIAPDVAMPVALHYVLHREHKARSLLVGDGPGILPSTDGSLIKKIVHSGFWRSMVRMTGAQAFIAGAFQLGYLHYSPNAEEVADYVASYRHRINQVTQWFKGYPDGLQSIDPFLANLDLPVQVFWADQDAFLSADNGQRLHDRLPNSALTIFENCGHFCYQDQSSAFTALVKSWIDGGYQGQQEQAAR
jgi:pimeloyl-ACP methyl ester carboxylesterase